MAGLGHRRLVDLISAWDVIRIIQDAKRIHTLVLQWIYSFKIVCKLVHFH